MKFEISSFNPDNEIDKKRREYPPRRIYEIKPFKANELIMAEGYDVSETKKILNQYRILSDIRKYMDRTEWSSDNKAYQPAEFIVKILNQRGQDEENFERVKEISNF